MTMTEDEAKLRYPLYCVDQGDVTEGQYLGPYPTHDDALGHADADDLVARCRRLKPSEIDMAAWRHGTCETVTDLVDSFNNVVDSGRVPDGAWWDWSRQAVHLEIDTDTLPTFDVLKTWADEHLRVDVYVCEGNDLHRVAPNERVAHVTEQLKAYRT